MGGAHDDAVLIGELRVERIVCGEGVIPHGGPEKVGLKAQQQFEDFCVELAVHGAERFFRPAAERGSFVVEEDAAVFDGRLGLEMAAGIDDERVMMRDAHVGPPVPGRDTDLGGEIVDAEDGAALIGAGDHQRAADAGQGTVDDRGDGGLPVAGDAGDVEFAAPYEAVDEGAVADGADEHGVSVTGFRGHVKECRLQAGDALYVRLEVAGGPNHAGPVGLVNEDGGRMAVRGKGEALGLRAEADVGGLA